MYIYQYICICIYIQGCHRLCGSARSCAFFWWLQRVWRELKRQSQPSGHGRCIYENKFYISYMRTHSIHNIWEHILYILYENTLYMYYMRTHSIYILWEHVLCIFYENTFYVYYMRTRSFYIIWDTFYIL
jgi:hypothetical protein